MKEFWNYVQAAFTAVGGWLGWFLGGCDGLIIALAVFAVLDYITGLMCAVIDKSLSSAIGFRGIFMKMMILILAGTAHTVDAQIIGSGDAIRSAVICFMLCNEGLSILENAGHIGIPIPPPLKAALVQLQKTDDKQED